MSEVAMVKDRSYACSQQSGYPLTRVAWAMNVAEHQKGVGVLLLLLLPEPLPGGISHGAESEAGSQQAPVVSPAPPS